MSKLPSAEYPISKITTDMNLNNNINVANSFEEKLRNELLEVYRNGMAMIFKYITLGENV